MPKRNTKQTNSVAKSKETIAPLAQAPKTIETVSELREYQALQKELEEDKRRKFASIQEAINLIDLAKTETRTYTAFNKEKLRTYLKNPKANENNLRNLAQFLYRMSNPFRRLIHYYADMVDLNAYKIVPLILDDEEPNEEDVLNRYRAGLRQMQKMNLAKELQKALVIVWREDAFFGYVYEDDDGFYIMPLNGDYCKISSVNYDGTFNLAFDFNFFRQGNNESLLEYWNEEFKQKYTAYQNDNNLRWQELEPDNTIVLKNNTDDPTLIVPPFVGIFESVIDLVDLQSLQSVKEELSNYKLLVNKIPLLDNAEEPDDFAVDLDTAVEFYNKLTAELPDLVGAVLSPLDITPVDFKDSNNTQDSDIIAQALNNVFSLSGTSSMLFNSNVSGSVGFAASVKTDTVMALSVIRQVEAWANRRLAIVNNDPNTKVRYLDVTEYNRADKLQELKTGGTLGTPDKLGLSVLMGNTPAEVYSLDFLENKVLKLHESWIPLSSSYTQSGSEDGGAPTVSDTELTDSGEQSRDSTE